MLSPQQIQRINELAAKQKITELTEQEQHEQQQLRRLYIDCVKANLKSQLDGIVPLKDK